MQLLISPKRTFWHEIDGVRFKLRTLTGGECAEMSDFMEWDESGDVNPKAGSLARRVAQIGLVGWDGLIDEDGSPLPFDNGKRKLDRLHFSVIIALFSRIWSTTGLGEETAGNSSSPTTSRVGDADTEADAQTTPNDESDTDATA